MIYKLGEKVPKISEKAFVAKSADVIGDVFLDEDANIWFGAALRGDENSITVKKGVNIQDNCTVHVANDYPTYIEECASIGHNAVIHGCTIGKYALVGMHATVLDGAEVGDYTIIGAGSLVTGGKKIPSGVLCMGSPAKVIRDLTEEEIETLKRNAKHYVKLSKEYMKEEE